MKCTEIRKKIQDFLSGTCSLSLYREISTHLEDCENCQKYANDIKKLLKELKRQPAPPVPTETQWNSIENSIFKNLEKKSGTFNKTFNLRSLVEWKKIAVAALFIGSFISIMGIIIGIKSFKKNSGYQTTENFTYPKLVNTVGSVSVINGRISAKNSEIKSKKSGITIKTADSSMTNVLLDKKTTLSLENNTICKISKLSVDTQVISLQQGNVLAKVGKREREQKFRIETPNAFCDVVGTRFKVWYSSNTVLEKEITRLAVYEGCVVFGIGVNMAVTVDSGYCIEAVGDSLGKVVKISEHKNRIENSIIVLSEPHDAIVNIDGKKIGVTPLTVNLVEGVHRIQVYKNGYSMWEENINFEKNGKDTVKAQLRTAFSMPKIKKSRIDCKVNVDTLIDKAIGFIDTGNIDSALAVLNNIVEDDKIMAETKVLALTKISYCQSNRGQYDKAIEALLRIVNGNYTKDQKGSALFRIATIKKDLIQDYEEAIKVLNKYFKEYSGGIWTEEVGFSLAELFLIKGMFSDAASVYEELRKTDISIKGKEKVLYNLAQIYMQHIKDSPHALDIFTLLNENFPESIYTEDALFWRANCLFEMGRISQSFKEYNNYLSTYPDGKWVEEIKIKLDKKVTVGVK